MNRSIHDVFMKALNHEWNRSMMCSGRMNSAEIRSHRDAQKALEHI